MCNPECTCGSTFTEVEDDDSVIIHFDDCALVQKGLVIW